MSEQEKDWTVAERFGANLMWLRCKARVSQQELADLTEMHRAQVAALERGGRIPRLDTILKLAAGLGVSPCDLIAWIRWEPARHYHYETPPSMAAVSGYEVLDFDLPAGFRVASVGYGTDEEFRARLKERTKKDRPVLERLRVDAPPLPPRQRPDAAWVLCTGRALRTLREERGLSRQQLADRSPTTAEFIAEIEEGRCGDPGLRMLEVLCRALKGRGSELCAQIELVRAEQGCRFQEVLDELAERDAGKTEEDGP